MNEQPGLNQKDQNVSLFQAEFNQAWKDHTLIWLVLSKPASDLEYARRIQIRPVEIKGERVLSFVFDYPTKQITKNSTIDVGMGQISVLLKGVYKNVHLLSSQSDIHLMYSKKMKSSMVYSRPSCSPPETTFHDKVKKNLLNIDGNQYLKVLGVVTERGQPAQHMQNKFKQISRFIETLDAVYTASTVSKKETINVVDMGSGKGYLTFAVYDYLRNLQKKDIHMRGVELREDLVSFCNDVANRCGFEQLKFRQGEIGTHHIDQCDILMALHACDTATDDAICKGIASDASIIITAPCCHKQIRKELRVENILKQIVNHGILAERQAEIVTDTLRGLMMEAFGYKTRIFEFIADAHTHKNVMIVGVRRRNKINRERILEQLAALKKIFGIESFYLENLMRNSEQAWISPKNFQPNRN